MSANHKLILLNVKKKEMKNDLEVTHFFFVNQNKRKYLTFYIKAYLRHYMSKIYNI